MVVVESKTRFLEMEPTFALDLIVVVSLTPEIETFAAGFCATLYSMVVNKPETSVRARLFKHYR